MAIELGGLMQDLKAVVLRASAGDCNAYEDLVRRFQDMAVGYAFALLGDWQEAEDAAQDAFIAAWRGSSSCGTRPPSQAGSGASCTRRRIAACARGSRCRSRWNWSVKSRWRGRRRTWRRGSCAPTWPRHRRPARSAAQCLAAALHERLRTERNRQLPADTARHGQVAPVSRKKAIEGEVDHIGRHFSPTSLAGRSIHTEGHAPV